MTDEEQLIAEIQQAADEINAALGRILVDYGHAAVEVGHAIAGTEEPAPDTRDVHGSLKVALVIAITVLSGVAGFLLRWLIEGLG